MRYSNMSFTKSASSASFCCGCHRRDHALSAQTDVKAIALKHLKTSRDFTLKVAEADAGACYDFKLTPPQMSFAEQMVHLSQALSVFVSPFSGQDPKPSKPASMSKKDVIAFIDLFRRAIAQVSKLTPEQISKTYQSEEGTLTGLEN